MCLRLLSKEIPRLESRNRMLKKRKIMRNNLETEKEHWLFLDGMKTVIIAKHIN